MIASYTLSYIIILLLDTCETVLDNGLAYFVLIMKLDSWSRMENNCFSYIIKLLCALGSTPQDPETPYIAAMAVLVVIIVVLVTVLAVVVVVLRYIIIIDI